MANISSFMSHFTNLCMQDTHQEVIVSRKRKEEAKKRKEELVGHTIMAINLFYPFSLSLSRRSSGRGPFSVVAVVCSWSLGTDSPPTSLRTLNLMNSFLY